MAIYTQAWVAGARKILETKWESTSKQEDACARSCVSTLLFPPHVTGAPATQVTAGVVQFLTLSPSSDQHQISPFNSNAL